MVLEDLVFKSLKPWYTVQLSLPGESVPGNETTAALEKRADATSPAVVTGMRTITENAAGSGTAIARGTATETAKERGRGSTDIARQQGRWVQEMLLSYVFVICSLLSSSSLFV